MDRERESDLIYFAVIQLILCINSITIHQSGTASYILYKNHELITELSVSLFYLMLMEPTKTNNKYLKKKY